MNFLKRHKGFLIAAGILFLAGFIYFGVSKPAVTVPEQHMVLEEQTAEEADAAAEVNQSGAEPSAQNAPFITEQKKTDAQTEDAMPKEASENKERKEEAASYPKANAEESNEETNPPKASAKNEEIKAQEASEKEETKTKEAPEAKAEQPIAKEPSPDKTAEPGVPTCTITVRCDVLLNHMEKLTPEKASLVPENGILLPETKVEFAEGDTVFELLQQELKKRGIHLAFQKVPVYDSVYIEAIGNLYEFDAGNLSGWMYRVNGKTPSVGCSQYKIKNGDKIEFLYTCNMGKDL